MAKNLVRGIIALILTAAAAWLADRIADALFGKDETAAA